MNFSRISGKIQAYFRLNSGEIRVSYSDFQTDFGELQELNLNFVISF